MNAIRYRWDGTRYRFIVEVIAEQPDGTAAMHLISKHETADDAAAAALKLRQERDDAAQDEAATLRAALEAVEFVSDDMCTYCPWCDANDNDMVIGDDSYKIQHKPDCQRQAALAQTSEVKA